ncbi:MULTISPECIES: hypothetical protein [Pseudoclavibacter]|uniref:Uncharacterized protein n=1 Tax=Pseudoclavibacter terrae TaxID=1530195 RepID=A0A7J5B099_9MICO|nr:MULTISPECIES: hypothetical protein [Pseudoclavibacter]KAB1637191.1 hypothetical protein F8O03_12980 [Pseudoclavibacter terrae]MBS3178720.1 hypothetical protein [Pseudoclavibacter sp. Marseille-Q4354]NYF14954.1 hypothetical protein [Pseudoclavibacter sp. JAI123]
MPFPVPPLTATMPAEGRVDRLSEHTYRVVKDGRILGFINKIDELCVVSAGSDAGAALEVLQTRDFARAVKELQDRA